MQPFERNRVPEGMTVYKPNNVVNNRYIVSTAHTIGKSFGATLSSSPAKIFTTLIRTTLYCA